MAELGNKHKIKVKMNIEKIIRSAQNATSLVFI